MKFEEKLTRKIHTTFLNLLKHARESQHTHVWNDDFKILNGNYKSNIKRKISEALYIRTLNPTSKRNQVDSNCITDLVAVISKLCSYMNSDLIDFSLSFTYNILQFLSYNVKYHEF